MFKVSFFKRKTQNQNKKPHAVKILAGGFLVVSFLVLLMIMSVVITGNVYAAIDNCPGSDTVNPYTCATTDDFTNKTVSDTSDDIPCTDINGSQFRTVMCYPDDYTSSEWGRCNNAFDRTDTCDGAYNSSYTCVPSEPIRSCQDIIDFNYKPCGRYNNHIKFKGYDITCYPDDIYGDWQTPPPYNPSDDGNIVSCNDSMCIKKDGSIITLPASPGLVCPVGFGCGGGFQCDSITHVCNEKNLICASNTNLSGKLPGNEWTETFRSLNGGAAYGYGTAMSGTDIYITGETLNAKTAISGLDVFLRKYDKGGNLLWEKIYDNGGNESGYGVAVDTSGRVYVVGKQDTNNSDMLLLQFDSAGTQTRVMTYDDDRDGSGVDNRDGSGVDIGKAVAVSGVTVYIAGHSQNSNGDIDAMLWSVNGLGGLFEVGRYSVGTNNESANAITISGSDIYTTGYTSTNYGDALTLKYNTGSLVWARAYQLSNITNIGNGVAVVAGSKKVFVTGYQSPDGGNMMLISYSATSTRGYPEKNEANYTSAPGNNNNDVGRGIITGASNERLYIVGSQQTSGEDMFLWASGLADPIVELYKGGKDSSSIERGFSLAGVGNIWSGAMYVAGYQDFNGGEAFLSKYSCEPPRQLSSISNGYFTVSPAVIYEDAKVTVDASKSDSGSNVFAWDWGDGVGSGTGVKSSYSYSAKGPYTIKLTIDGKQTVTQAITVLENHLPIASFTVDPAGGGATPLVMKVDGSASDSDDDLSSVLDPGDYIKSFTWQWGDGTADGHGEKTTHLYSSDGSYTIKLTVTDSNNDTNDLSIGIIVTKQYECGGAGCSGDKPVCWTEPDGSGNQCYECVPGTGYQCDSGMRCLGEVCKAGQKCGDGNECPADGICLESEACKVASVCADGSYCPSSGQCPSQSCVAGEKTCAGGTVCPSNNICPTETCKPAGACSDGGSCPDSGWCGPKKNVCILGSETSLNQCYTETNGACTSDAECNAGIQGGACDLNDKKDDGITPNPYYQQCKYAHCLNLTDITCETDKDCNDADGICDPSKKTCDYVYDCAYGLGMNTGATSTAVTSITAMPAMPVGVQPDGQACTKPTADAPTNCEGINGCLYYNYFVEAVNKTGVPMPGDSTVNAIGNGVASCLNKFEGGTGCVYYGDQAGANSRANCLPGTDFKKLKSKTAPPGISADCVAFDKGNGKKEYDCTGVAGNHCYYYLNGVVDCDYVDGTGCIYSPNPAGAQMCPKTLKAPTSGKDFVQCLLNPDALLPAFLLDSGKSGLSACRVNADCPAGQMCLDGTCYPECQNDLSCVTGESCVKSCDTAEDCEGNLICEGYCKEPKDCVHGEICPNGVICPLNGFCPPSTFSCSDTTVQHNLPYGSASAPISVSSSQNASCRWSLFDLPFVNMSNPFSTGDSLNHTVAAVTGLPDAGLATIFTKCDTGAGQTTSCNVGLKIGTTCGNDADCPLGMECSDAGYCIAPTCANAQPFGTLPFETLANGTTTSMTTSLNSNCVRSNDYSKTNQCVAPILSCATATPFTITGGKTHSSLLSGASLVEGNNTQFVKCQETESPQEKLSDTCKIPFNIVTCWTDSDCQSDWNCEAVGISGPGVCIPPACAGAYPTGKLPYTAETTDFGLTTNATSTCAYSGDYNDPYSAMTEFTGTGGLTHSSNIPVTRKSEVYKYAICNETATNTETKVCTIHFKVGDLLPICGGAHPKGRQDVGVDLPIGLVTNQAALCKFADTYDNLATPENRFGNMPNNFRSIAGVTHGTDGALQDTVTVVQGDNTKYVACRETSAPNKITECRIPFSGRGSCNKAWDCEFGLSCNVSTGDCIDCITNPELLECPPDPCLTNSSLPECIPNPCQIMPDLPGCSNAPSFCSLHPDDPTCSGSCNTLGYEFHGSAIKPSGNCSLLAIILALLSWLAWVVALLAVFSGLRAAYLYITSAGDEKKLRLAYQYLIYTTIGVGVAILSFSAVAITRAIFNI